MKDFRQLKVWERAHELALAVYKSTSNFPREELYGLTSQIRRSSMSIPTNIAEGCGRGSDADFAHFLQIAMGSACETEYQLLLSKDLGFIHPDEYSTLQELAQEVKRMISGLLKTLHANSRVLIAES
jgi:four helix bundle protein